MTASLWTKALGVAEHSLLIRSARCARSSCRNVVRTGQFTAVRRVSAYRSSAEPAPSLDPGAPATPIDVAETRAEPNSEQPLFTALEGSLSPSTLKAITVKPFQLKHMTPVQTAVLSLLPQLSEPWAKVKDIPEGEKRTPRDLLVKARTGTGKTLAFLVPAIEARQKSIDAHGKQAVIDAGLTTDRSLELRAKRIFSRENVGTLIISPTRELATQIANEAIRLSHHHEGFEVRLFTGGNSKKMQMRDWMRGRRDIVVCTPGRLRDLLASEPTIEKGIAATQMLILDEADTLLDMGFREDIEAIMEYIPSSPERQTFLFSATVSTEIRQIARKTLAKEHLFINCVEDNASPVHAHIPQYHTVLPNAAAQIPHVLRLLAHDQLTNPGRAKSIIFLPTTKMTQLYASFLRQLLKVLPTGRKTTIYEMHSKRQQSSRDNVSEAFRRDNTGSAILVSSDVSARGVDYPGVTRIIQIGIPGGTDQYIHRVGRTGRAGSTSGRADLVLLPWEVGFVSWLLTDIPLKPLTTNELKNQVTELAKKYDEDPSKFYQDAGVIVNSRAPERQRPALFPEQYSPVLEQFSDAISHLCSTLDEEAVKETMMSLLGYYLSKSGELRVQKSVIVQGLKDWTTEACELPVAPYVSEAFLAKLGLQDGRTKNFGKPKDFGRGGFGSRGSQPHWMGRGSSSNKDRERSQERSQWGVRSEDGERSVRSGDRERGVRFGDRERGVRSGDRERGARSGDRERGVRSGDRERGDRWSRNNEDGGEDDYRTEGYRHRSSASSRY
ncbi:P-loop containing nucleoside triphosphate hydrolase protein [Sparassis latifolia]|uniref:ATP-dependent RNA helicase n=1 Tax=Sparassis crispa TaxID=139825 RepID=A0A401GZ57_9APHY|nr:ATP-dependent RNA helicase mss116, mitochondrial [Sparassis crispa]GBE87445.1 ATP-dependent RNA helicase mss116, mitochondrial [Sparassis crispa]